MDDFKPPMHNQLVIKTAQLLIPVASRKAQLDIRLQPDLLARFRQYKGEQAMIMMNHADRYDPMVAFWLAHLCGEDFYYLAARELFDDPWNGWVLQSCGTYSVVRGHSPESTSAKKTIDIIAQEAKKLVMFPEGDVTGRDDAILPLKKDGIGNVLKAQMKVREREPGKTVHVLPISVFFKFDGNVDALVESIDKLESAFGLQSVGSGLETRVMRLVNTLISRIENEYRLKTDPNTPSERRLKQLSKQMTLAVAAFAGCELGQFDHEAELLYNVRGSLRQMVCRQPSCEHDTKAAERLQEKAELCVRELDRIQQLLILASTLEQPFSLEVAWRILDRLEQEVFEKLSPKGHRTAYLALGNAVEMKQYESAYISDSSWTTDLAEDKIREAMLFALNAARDLAGGPTTDHLTRTIGNVYD